MDQALTRPRTNENLDRPAGRARSTPGAALGTALGILALSLLLPALARATAFPNLNRDLDLSYSAQGAGENLALFLMNLGLAGGVPLGAVWAFTRLRRRNQAREWEESARERADETRAILVRVERERIKVDMALTANRLVPCTLLEVGGAEIVLEVPDYAKVGDSFIGREVRCYFRIADKEAPDAPANYNFPTRMTAQETGPRGERAFRATLPTDLYVGQKRASFRLTPAPDLILDGKAWPGSLAAKPVCDLRQPSLHFGRGGVSTVTKLLDLSGAGMRVVSTSKQLAFSPLEPRVGANWLFSLRVKGRRKTHTWWVVGRVVKTMERGKNQVELAFRFSQYATAMDQWGRIQWQPILQEEGVQAIATWVFKRHTDLVRQGYADADAA